MTSAAHTFEEELRADDVQESENRFHLILDAIPGMVCALNAAGEVELHNQQVLEHFGKTTEELKNWATADVLHPDDLARMIDAWRYSIDTGEPLDLDHRSRGADGVYRWFHIRGRAQRDAEGGIV